MKKINKSLLIVTILIVTIMIAIAFCVVKITNATDSKKLINAINSQDINLIEKIINKNPASVNSFSHSIPEGLNLLFTERNSYYPLEAACMVGNTEIVEILIENGAVLNPKGDHSPLSAAYSSKCDNWYEISLLLIKKGSSIDYTKKYAGGYAQIFTDIVSGPNWNYNLNKDSEKVLLSLQYALKNVRTKTINWSLVYIYSINYDGTDIVDFLLTKGFCDPNEIINSEITPLCLAARNSTPDMIKILLSHDADINAKSLDGKTAYEYALENEKWDNAEILRTQ